MALFSCCSSMCLQCSVLLRLLLLIRVHPSHSPPCCSPSSSFSTWCCFTSRSSSSCFAMDGVVLSIPPRDAVGRWNHVFGAEDHMWRKAGEAAQPELSGDAPYSHQVPLERAVPLWGGVSEGGFAIVFFTRGRRRTPSSGPAPSMEESSWAPSAPSTSTDAVGRGKCSVTTSLSWRRARRHTSARR